MSIKVELHDLAAAMEAYPFAYFLTVSEDGRPHAVAVAATWNGSSDGLVLDVGRRTAANAVARTKVALVFPPVEVGGYSLIVDGDSSLDEPTGHIDFAPSTAVLHRPALPGQPVVAGACGNDCVPVTPPAE
jgi:hypothetical protein